MGIRVKSSHFNGMVLYHCSAIGIYLKLIDLKHMVFLVLQFQPLHQVVVAVWYALQLERFGGSIVALTKPNYVWCFSDVSCRSLLAH